jgi:hypothetical protein
MIIFVNLSKKEIYRMAKAIDNLTAAVTALTAVTAQAVTALGTVAGGGTPDSLIQPQADLINAAVTSLTGALGGTATGVPAVPTGLVATPSPSGTVSLSFPAVPGATSYSISRTQTSGSGYALVGSVTTPSFSESGLPVGQFFYVASATNSSGTSANSAEVAVTTTA